ncbi:MAG: YqgE/AlgH family protein [Nitrospirae bacterium]|nr:YqgE/AlgH family protein [Nitrospirota bacterium]
MKRPFHIFLVVLFIFISPLIVGFQYNRSDVTLKQGIFLAAKPELMDPNFIHTVILLVSYGKDGALGLIINRPAGMYLEKVLPDAEEIEDMSHPLFLGGPVNQNSLCILFTSDDTVKETQKIFDDIYFTCIKDAIIPILKKHEKNKKVRVYAGISAWAPGQLEQEIKRGAWITREANQDSIFSEEPLSIWPSIYKIPEELLI